MKVLSLFDGISAGQVALERAGINVTTYFASEIDKYAISVTNKNYPNTVQLGNVLDIRTWDLPEIDLLIGGSPCQSFSKSGKQEGFDGESKLFWEYVRILAEANPKYFLLENVVMKKEWQDVISHAVGVEPILINSSLLSAQNRPRLYWTNIPNITQPNDKGLILRDIISGDPVADKFYLSDKAVDYMNRLRNDKPRWEYHKNPLDGKAACLTANMWKGVPYGVVRELNRRLTPTECEALQTFPENYTEGISDTQRYKAIGNSWTVDIITHILKHIPNE